MNTFQKPQGLSLNHTPQLLNELLYKMLLIRSFEEKTAGMYGLRKIGGFCHLYIGEEAVATGAISALDLSKDYVFATYREHGHALVSGLDPKKIMAELYGKDTGCSRGKGGSMHLFDINKHFYGGNGIVGAHTPVATGAALKIKYQEEDGVVLCFLGDGAFHQGVLNESMNMARIWNLPIVYIVENNQYGMGTDYQRVSAIFDFSKTALAYNMFGKQVDGMDVLAVYDGIKEAIASAKSGIPALIEAKTYRYKGHSMSDPAKYRSKNELEMHKNDDPIDDLVQKMKDVGLLSEEKLNQLKSEIKEIVTSATEFAENSPSPAPEELWTDVLAPTNLTHSQQDL